jgi:hypothetical protein
MKKLLKTALKIIVFPFALVAAIFLVARDLRWEDIKKGKVSAREKTKTVENVTYKVTDKKGNIKKLFKHNFLGKMLFRLGYDLKWFFLGRKVDELSIANTVTNVAFADVAGLINGATSPASYEYIGIGTGTTAAAATDTALETEINNDGNPSFTNRGGAGAASLVTTTVTNDTAQVVQTFTIGAFTPAVTESGLLNSNTAGTLFARQVFSAVNLSSGDNFQVTWKIAVS